MGTYLKAIVLVIILLFLTTFGIKNNQPLQLYYYFNIETFHIPLYGVVYISIIIGVIIGMLVGISARYSMWRMVRSLEREIKELKGTIEEKAKQGQPLTTSPAEGGEMG